MTINKANVKNRMVTKYQEATNRDVTYSNVFNLSFGRLSERENKVFDFMISQINLDDLKKGENDYAISYDLLIKMLNRGNSARGASAADLKEVLLSLMSLAFCVPDYENNRLIIDTFFNKIYMYNGDMKYVEFSFTDTAFPYIMKYRDIGFGAYMIPFNLFDRIKSKKAYLILKAVSGKLNGNKQGIANFSPEVWNVAFNGEKGKRETVKQITRDIKRGVDYLNNSLSDFFNMEYSINKKGRKIFTIAVTATLISDVIRSTPKSSKKKTIDLNKYDRSLPKEILDNRKKASNGDFKVIGSTDNLSDKHTNKTSKKIRKSAKNLAVLDTNDCI